MKIGHARICLSPTNDEFYLIGYRSPTRLEPALGIHDDIYANSLLFDDGFKKVFIFSADFIEFEEDMVKEVQSRLSKKYDLEPDHILFVATHNHSSVVGYHKSWYTGKFNQEYYDFLLESIEKSFLTCLSNLQEAQARFGRKNIYGYYNDRNHKDQDADQEVIVVEFIDDNGVPFSGFVNWAVHSTVISPNNRYLTSEWAGLVSKKLQEKWGYFPAMIVGAAADCSNRNLRRGNDFTELERVSTGMALEISQIPLTNKLQLERIESLFETYRIKYDPSEMKEKNRRAIREYEEELQNCKDKERIAFVKKEIQKLSEFLDLTDVDISFDMGVIDIGDLLLIVFPGELDSKFGKILKDDDKKLSIVMGYTNGYFGYFMPEEEYGLSFETIGSLIPKGEPEKIVSRLKNMIKNR